MKKFLLLPVFIFLMFAFNASGQDYEDVIYLKNGSVIRGLIIEQIPSVSLKMQTKDGNIFVYKIEEVEKMAKEQPFVQIRDKNNIKYSEQKYNKRRGYFGLVEIGLAPGVDNGSHVYDKFRIGATIINGYRIIPQFAVGVGIGIQGYTEYKEMAIPIFLHLRSDFLNKPISPYLAFNVGYNLSVLGGVYGGLMLEPSLGAGFNIGSRYRINAGLGFAIDNTFYYRYYYVSNELKVSGPWQGWAYAINIKIGFAF